MCLDFKTGLTIQVDGEPIKIIEFQHVKQARGAASTKTKFKNLITGATLQRTVQAAESFDPAQIDRSTAQHTYVDGELWYFMDSETFEEKAVSSSIIDDRADWIMEGMELGLVSFQGSVIDINLPSTMELEVVQTDPNVKGNSAQGVTKPATLECGATISVPGFIEQGEKILVDVANKNYMSRAKN